MRRGYRSGQSIADALRIEIRDLEERDDHKNSDKPHTPDTPDSPDTPSPKTTSFPPAATTTVSAAPPAVTVPPNILTSIASEIPTKPTSTLRQVGQDVTSTGLLSSQTAAPANNSLNEKEGNGKGSGISKTGIAFGVIGALGLLILIGFLIWKCWSRRKQASRDHLADEKRWRDSHGDQEPILLRTPDPVAYPANRDRFEVPVGSWLTRHTSQMLNPWMPRASMTPSAAAALQTPDQPRPDDSVSQAGGNAMPPPGFQPPMPLMPQQYQHQQQEQASGQPYYPITVDPQRIPPPPAPQRLSVAETNRTSGTWNTWGIQQHQTEKPKGWKAKLTGRQR